jgi:hypothetical protein
LRPPAADRRRRAKRAALDVVEKLLTIGGADNRRHGAGTGVETRAVSAMLDGAVSGAA